MAEIVNEAFDHVTDVIALNLSARHPIRLDRARAASAVVAGYEIGGAAHYCLIKRAKRGRNAGQWALPGGKVETGETRLEAALREAEEEVALSRQSTWVIGRLDDIATQSGFVMSAFVAAAPTGWRPMAASPEVQGVHEFAVADLVADDVVRWARVDDGPRL